MHNCAGPPVPHSSLLAWGVLQRCDDLDGAVLAEFVLTHAGANVEHRHRIAAGRPAAATDPADQPTAVPGRRRPG